MTDATTPTSIFRHATEVPESFQPNAPFHQLDYLVDGKMRAWEGERQEVQSPVYLNGPAGLQAVSLGSIPLVGEKESMELLDAAVRAYRNGRGAWATASVDERIRCMEAFTNKMVQSRDYVVKMLMWEIGKSQADSQKEFDRTVQYIYDTIDALKKADRDGSRFILTEGIIAQVRRAPLGVVLCMGPFNYPLNETFTLLIPALLMGNTVIFKVPRLGALLHYPMMQAFAETMPPGTVNYLFGKGSITIPPLMTSGQVDVLTLIGSSRMADQLRKQHPRTNRLRAILGLDAKNAGIVLDCADLDVAVKECIAGTLSFNGQRCTALKILFVHRKVQDAFLEKLSAAVDALPVGMPWDAKVAITPVAEPEKPAYLKSCIDDALAKGARIVNPKGGQIEHSFVSPTILFPINDQMKLYREEQFGPLLPVVPFDDIEATIDYLMHSNFGQQVSIFGNDASRVAALIDPLANQVCRVNVNVQCQRGPDVLPFTGRKDSAERTLSVTDALRSFSLPTMVATKETAENKHLFNEIIRSNESNFLSTRFIF